MKKNLETQGDDPRRCRKPGIKNLLPYFALAPSSLVALSRSPAFVVIVYGVASGFGLPTMIDQVFPQNLSCSGKLGTDPPLSTFWQLFLYVSVSSGLSS